MGPERVPPHFFCSRTQGGLPDHVWGCSRDTRIHVPDLRYICLCCPWKCSNTPEIGSYPIIIYVFIFWKFNFLTFLRWCDNFHWKNRENWGDQWEKPQCWIFWKFWNWVRSLKITPLAMGPLYVVRFLLWSRFSCKNPSPKAPFHMTNLTFKRIQNVQIIQKSLFATRKSFSVEFPSEMGAKKWWPRAVSGGKRTKVRVFWINLLVFQEGRILLKVRFVIWIWAPK